MQNIGMSSKLDNVCYDIRGPVLKHAKRMEEEGHKILKLNIKGKTYISVNKLKLYLIIKFITQKLN